MTEEEKKAIEMLEYIKEANTLIGCNLTNRDYLARILLNLIQKQDTEINKLNNVIDRIIKEFYKRANISKKCWMQNANGIEECFKNKNCLECLKEYFMKEDK